MLWLNIDRSANIPLTKQVCEQLRTKILKRDLRAGDRLPPTRRLAQDLNVSRNVIIYAYEQLVAEGYLESREGSGTYVAQGTYLEDYKDYSKYEFHLNIAGNEKKPDQDIIDFNIGVPDMRQVPRKIWARLLREACLDAPEALFSYGSSQGLLSLRQTLSKFLLKTKGIRCHPEQIIILSGAMQAFAILAKLFAASCHEVILEDPSFNHIQHILKSTGFSFYPVPVDEKGIQADRIPLDREASFVIVTPSHHFPLGSVLPIQRRVKLIEYARKMDTYIIENDYDSEFRYAGAPISALHLLDPGYVIYVGTFSESLYPALRLGYMILPESLLEPCRRIMSLSGAGISIIKQIALEMFIQEGHLERHITKMKKLYRKKREAVIAALQAEFSSHIIISGDATGLYVVVEFPGIDFSGDVLEELQEYGVRVYAVEEHAIVKGRHRNKLFLGYGNLSIEDIEAGLKRMKNALF